MRLTVVVLDSVGAGELPDAAEFGDAGAHTINHTLESSGARLPNLARLGLAKVPSVRITSDGAYGPSSGLSAEGAYGRMREVSRGKDTSTGHWEFAGIQLEHPFRVYPDGFPPEVMTAFEQATGRGWLCNLPYSGTDVIRDYGQEHVTTGKPIVYTSADSVFQIATHVGVVPLETLYEWCRAARAILTGENAVARVIARPFSGEHPYQRLNEARRDFSLEPPANVIDALHAAGRDVIGIGKIPDIYANRGFTQSIHTDHNVDGINKTLEVMRSDFDGLAFANLVDFDAKYGHRRDPAGYGRALEQFDAALPEFLAAVGEDDAIILVSDHGNDPTWHGTDHTREHGLLLAYRPGLRDVDLGERATFADLAATIAEALQVNWAGPGTSFWGRLRA